MSIISNYEIVFQSPLVSYVENAPIYLLGEDHGNFENKALNATLIHQKIVDSNVLLLESCQAFESIPEEFKDENFNEYKILDSDRSNLVLLGWDAVAEDIDLISRVKQSLKEVDFLSKAKKIIKKSIVEDRGMIEDRVQEWGVLLKDFAFRCNLINKERLIGLVDVDWDRFRNRVHSLAARVNRIKNLLKDFDKSDDFYVFKMNKIMKNFKREVKICLKSCSVNKDEVCAYHSWLLNRLAEIMPLRTKQMAEAVDLTYRVRQALGSRIFLIAGSGHLKVLNSFRNDPRFSLEGFYERMKSLPVVALIPKSIANS